MKFCECGCGGVAPIARQSNPKRGHVKGQPCRFIVGHNHMGTTRKSGYAVKYAPEHPKAQNGAVYLHVLIAEAALGRHMPDGVEIHHVDGNSLNNSNRNLVICQDKAYHKLLHVRARTIAAGGDPDTERLCATCRSPKPFAAFNRMAGNKSHGLQNACRECQRADQLARQAKRHANAA